MKRIVAAVLAAASFNCMAGTWIDISATSYHVGGNKQFNSRNFGAGLEYDKGNFLAMGGRYSNSLGTPSRYALLGWTPIHLFGADIGGVIGALDGYKPMNDGKPFLAAAAMIRWTEKDFRAQLMVLPPIKESITHDAAGGTYTHHGSPLAVGLMFGWRFH